MFYTFSFGATKFETSRRSYLISMGMSVLGHFELIELCSSVCLAITLEGSDRLPSNLVRGNIFLKPLQVRKWIMSDSQNDNIM